MQGAAARRRSRLPVVVGAVLATLGLLVLVLVGMPLKYLGGDGTVVAIVGPIHGFLYMGYLLLTADLAYRDFFTGVDGAHETIVIARTAAHPGIQFI